MKKPQYVWFLGAIGVLIVLGLMTGCYRPAAPDVTATPPPGAQETPSEEEQVALAETESARATQTAEAMTQTAAVASDTPTPTATATHTPVPTTPPAATETPTPTATAQPSGQVTHVVQRGENMFRIALRYGTTVEAIASANSIANPALIYVGQRLIIPSSGGQVSPPPAGATTYVVQPGDNLFRIALRYNLSYIYLAQYNGIANPSRIYVGQVIRIPPR